MEPKELRAADHQEPGTGQDRVNPRGFDRTAERNTETGLTTNVGFHNPGSPGDVMGSDPFPSVGGVGAQDPGAGGDTMGDDEGHDLGITNDEEPPERSAGSGSSASS